MTTPTCQIKWVDAQGNPTPDDNPSIGRVRCKGHVGQFHGRAIEFSTSEWFHICADHAKRLTAPGMHNWECEAVS